MILHASVFGCSSDRGSVSRNSSFPKPIHRVRISWFYWPELCLCVTRRSAASMALRRCSSAPTALHVTSRKLQRLPSPKVRYEIVMNIRRNPFAGAFGSALVAIVFLAAGVLRECPLGLFKVVWMGQLKRV